MLSNTPTSGSRTPTPAFTASLHGVAQLWRVGGAPLGLERKQALLLAYLWIEGPTSRGRLAGLLWPDAAEARARGYLRQRLAVLRQAVGEDLVVDAQGVLALSARLALTPADPGSPLLLSTFEYGDCEDCAAWLEGQREAQRSRQRADLLGAVRLAVQQGQLDQALRCADQLLALDRESEEAYRTQMEVLYLRGDTAAAIAVWDRCKEMLRQLYGVAPSATTRQLGETILHAANSAAPSPTAAAVSIPVTVLRPPRLVSRQPLLRQLMAGWQAGLTLCVSGESGLGKTRLLAEFGALAGPCAVTSARPGDAVVPYASLSRLLLAAIDRFEPALDGPDARQAARLLPRLAALLPDAPPDPVQTDHERRQCLRALARLFSQCAARGCSALVFDDLQFADMASAEALLELAEAPAATAGAATPRLVLGARGTELSASVSALLDSLVAAGRCRRMELQPLDPAGVAELIASLGLPGLDAAALARRLWAQVGGNPAFVLESIKLLLALGGSAAADSAALPLAPDIIAVIERRIGLLSPPARHLAQLAAIAGDSYSVPLAAAALACAPLALSEPLRELELRQVLYGRQFVHDVIAVAVRRTVAQAVAEFMHRFVAEYLQQHDGDAARVAGHWLACGEHGQAGDAFIRAASGAEKSSRPVEQCQLLDAAADCYERAGMADALFDAVEAGLLTMNELGRSPTRLAQIERLEALARSPVQGLRALRHRQHLESDHAHSSTVEVAQAAVAQALALHRSDLAFEFAGLAAWRLATWGQEAQAMHTLDAHRHWVMTQGTVDERADFHRLRSGVLGMSDRLEPAIDEARLALVEQRAAGRPVRMLMTLNNMGLFLHWRGQLSDAKATLTQAVELRDRLHGPGANMFDLLLALVLHDLGEYAGGEGLLVRAIADLRARAGARADDIHNNLVAGENYLAQLWLTLGQPARALAQLVSDDSDLAPRSRWRRLTLQLRAARLRGHVDDVLLVQAETMLKVQDSPFNRTLLELEAALAIPPAQALPVYTRLQGLPVVLERPGLHMHVAARAAQAHLNLGATEAAWAQVRQVQVLLASGPPFDIERAEVWWTIAQTLSAVGDATAGQAVLRHGAAWLHDTARHHVVEHWQHGFLYGNPANRRLLAAAGG